MILPNLEYLIVHHCNLNCKGCNKFSPISEEYFADIVEFKKDIIKISELFNIQEFKILGGEPLLHPKLNKFLILSKSILKDTKITLITNGLLLPKLPELTWKIIKKYNINISLSIYPNCKINEYLNLFRIHDVSFELKYKNYFDIPLILKGTEDPVKSMNYCQNVLNEFCPVIISGKIYPCGYSALIYKFNERFGLDLPKTKGLNLYSKNLTPLDIFNYLTTPTPLCCHCQGMNRQRCSWSRSLKCLDEWIYPKI